MLQVEQIHSLRDVIDIEQHRQFTPSGGRRHVGDAPFGDAKASATAPTSCSSKARHGRILRDMVNTRSPALLGITAWTRPIGSMLENAMRCPGLL
jgi:hypothetical protein